ncbi:MAG: hypothetical protein NZM09_10780, partial [Ignavibacterium sp.]|nr:hypothetical protein [Ignavibacterium sp.]MDW8376162.1 hypothetical protein [Ignavibacteriales bacterium]
MKNFKKILRCYFIKAKFLLIPSFIILTGNSSAQNLLPIVPPEWRGTIDAERKGVHDANLIRTMFYNFGMVGDYPPDPLNVDLSV